MKDKLLERFLRYISIDTQSNPESDETPSNKNEFKLARMLAEELKAMGFTDAHVDDNAYVMAGLASNVSHKVASIGFIAHLDTSPDMSGKNIKPQIHPDYDGGDIVLHEEKQIIMHADDFPALKNYRGQTLITGDGTTLLGADNKAGIAAIMTAAEELATNPGIPHGAIKIGFTPDEEIGKGADHFDVKKFDADFAFTVDGGEVGELQYENFNAAHARLWIRGRNIHPGEAAGKMINAMIIGMEFNQMLPEMERPEHTTGYQGFYHIHSFKGDVDQAVLEYIVRDHDKQKFEQRKSRLRRAASLLNEKYGKGSIRLEIKDQYYNMHTRIIPVFDIIELAREAMKAVHVKPLIRPIRGGTDGARLSYMGLPCPNLFTGGHNFHGRYEFIPLESMEKATKVILKIIELAARK